MLIFLSDFIVISFCLSQSFCLIAAARIVTSSFRKSLFTLIVLQTAIFIHLKSLNNRVLMKKLSTNSTKSKSEERLLHNCMINKEEEVNFQLLIENLNSFAVFNSLILAI
jgi:hypothetical protein